MVALGAVEPPAWILVFNKETTLRWVKWLARGKYKHVKAFAYVPTLNIWLFYDVGFDRTGLVVAPNDQGTVRGYLAEFVNDADLMAAPQLGKCRPIVRLGFWCVPAIKHLIGLPSRALLPDRLWRDCLKAGGVPLAPAA